MPVHSCIPWCYQSFPSGSYCLSTLGSFLNFLLPLLLLLCVQVQMCYGGTHVWRVESLGSLFSPAMSVLGDWTQVGSLGSKHLYLLSPLVNPQLDLNRNPHNAGFLRVSSYKWVSGWEGIPFKPCLWRALSTCSHKLSDLTRQPSLSPPPCTVCTNTTSHWFVSLWRLQAWASVLCFLAFLGLGNYSFILCPFR